MGAGRGSRRSRERSSSCSRSAWSWESSGRVCVDPKHPSSSSSCRLKRRQLWASASRGRLETRHWRLRIGSPTGSTSTPRVELSSCHAAPAAPSPLSRRTARGGRARSRSRVARRTGARRVRPRDCRPRPRNQRLAAEVRSQLAEVRASRERIVSAADAERRRIERNLHDGAQQRLVTLSVALGLEASGRLGCDDRGSFARARRGRAGNHRATRPRARNSSDPSRDEGLQIAVERWHDARRYR